MTLMELRKRPHWSFSSLNSLLNTALAVVGDLVDSDVTSIQELLDGFLFVGDAEAVLNSM